MKKLAVVVLGLMFFVGLIWLCSEKSPEAIAQYDTGSYRTIYSKSTTIIVDNANGTNTGVIPITLSQAAGGHGVAWGSFCTFVEVDTLTKTGKKSAQDSLTIYYKELKSYTSSSSYETSDFDSTALTSNLDWTHGKTKKLSLAPDVCYGFEFRATHATVISDSIRVTITLVYQ